MKSNNDNALLSSKSTMNNDNVRARKAESIALRLVEKLKSQESYKFYLKVAYSLPENQIWANLEAAQSGRNPGGLFNWLCRRDMLRG